VFEHLELLELLLPMLKANFNWWRLMSNDLG
jgi:hypothetical protein